MKTWLISLILLLMCGAALNGCLYRDMPASEAREIFRAHDSSPGA